MGISHLKASRGESVFERAPDVLHRVPIVVPADVTALSRDFPTDVAFAHVENLFRVYAISAAAGPNLSQFNHHPPISKKRNAKCIHFCCDYCYTVMLPLVISPFLSQFQENKPSPPQSDEDGAEESGQELISPESYIKHPLQNRSMPSD